MEQVRKQTLLMLVIYLTSVGFLVAQDFKKADDLYRMKSYAEAIPLYEKGLEEKDSYSARSKLAYSYKMLNQMSKAAEQYALVIQNERVRPDEYFYYGETLMSQAKYEDAKIWFLKFHELEPDEEKGLRMANACDQVPLLVPIFPDAIVMEFPFNTAYDDSSPVFYNNDLVFSSDRKAGVKFLKQKSGTTGRDFIRLYSSTLNANQEWSEPGSFSNKLNENNKNNANASFRPDGSEVYLTRNGNVSNRNNAFTLQLYRAKFEKDKWKDVEVLSVCRLEHNYMHPAISPDGNTLFFVSDKPGGKGGTDIYYAEKKGDDWGRVINLDTTINTSAHEGFPFMNEDGKLYFCSKGHIGYGGFDIFVTEKEKDGTWSKPVNVGQPINSPLDDISIFINKENTKGAFTSSRNGYGDDIFLFSLDGSAPVAASQAVAPVDMVVAESIIEERNTDVMEMEITESASSVTSDQAANTNEPIIEMPSIEKAKTGKTASTTNESAANSNPASVGTSTSTTTQKVKETDAPEVVIKEESLTTTDISTTQTTAVDTTVMEVKPVGKMEKPDSVTAAESPKTEMANQQKLEQPNDDNTSVTTPEIVESQKQEITSAKLAEPETPAQKIIAEETLAVKETVSETTEKTTSEKEANQDIIIEATPSDTEEENFQQDFSGSAGSKTELTQKVFQKAVSKGKYQVGMYYLIEDMTYFPGEYLLVPKMTLQLDPIVEMLMEQPELKLEISVHTESIGYDENNLIISQKRAKAIKNYLLYKGIDAARVNSIGLGESQLVNHCSNGVVCTEEEHLANQRVEVRIR